jgi:hypothetical protein
MPLIKIDYNETLLDENKINLLIKDLLNESMRIYNTGEEKVSIFTAPYGKHSFSTAAAEIELRARLAEFDRPDKSRDEARQEQMEEYEKFLKDFIARHKLQKGIVFTITFEDWQVVWVEGLKDKV